VGLNGGFAEFQMGAPDGADSMRLTVMKK